MRDSNASIKKTSKEFNVCPKRVREWNKQFDKFKEVIETRDLKGRNVRRLRECKAQYQEIDREVFEKFREYRAKKLIVNTEDLQAWAMESFNRLISEGKIPPEKRGTFTASTGWVHRFTSRNKIVSRAITTQGQKVRQVHI